MSELDCVVDITFVSNLKSSISRVFNAVTLSVPTVVKFNVFEIVVIVLPLTLTSPIYAVSYTHLTLPTTPYV